MGPIDTASGAPCIYQEVGSWNYARLETEAAKWVPQSGAVNGCSQRVQPTSAANGCSQRLQPTSAANICSQRVQPTSAANGCSQRLQPTSAANICSQRVQPTSAANGCSQHLQPTSAANGCSQRLQPTGSANGSINGESACDALVNVEENDLKGFPILDQFWCKSPRFIQNQYSHRLIHESAVTMHSFRIGRLSGDFTE